MHVPRKLRALGITSGVGSMLIGARDLGYKIVGNFEWRKYYHKKDANGKNTFTENFKGAFFTEQYPQDYPNWLSEVQNIDIVYGHGECGHASMLNANRATAQHGFSDIPKLVEALGLVKPRFFALDNLPASCSGMPISEYHRMLPDYDIFPEWVSNYHYGNVQKQRKRMFMLGALKSENSAFVPGEFDHHLTVADVIGDIYKKEGKFPNHEKHELDALCAKGYHLKYRGHRATWKEMRDYVINEMGEGKPIEYVGADGSKSLRIGSYKGYWDGPAHVLTGGISGFHSRTGLPYTVRERARIQGFPDDFIFYGTVLNKKGEWNHDKNGHMVRQTGKAMPIQFNAYVALQVERHLHGKKFKGTNERYLSPNAMVDDSKRWFCENVGYTNQKGACNACWLRDKCKLACFAGTEPGNGLK